MSELKIVCIGDVVGETGRNLLKSYLGKIKIRLFSRYGHCKY